MDRLGLGYSIMVHVPEDGSGRASRHIVMDDSEVKAVPGLLSLPLMLSRDGFWCMYTRYGPNVPICPDCRTWLRDRVRRRSAALAEARSSFYEIASG